MKFKIVMSSMFFIALLVMGQGTMMNDVGGGGSNPVVPTSTNGLFTGTAVSNVVASAANGSSNYTASAVASAANGNSNYTISVVGGYVSTNRISEYNGVYGDGAVVTLNAAQGVNSSFRVSVTNDLTLYITNARSGQPVIVEFFNTEASKVLTLPSTNFTYSQASGCITNFALCGVQGRADYMGARWEGNSNRWHIIALSTNY